MTKMSEDHGRNVSSVSELFAALRDGEVKVITVSEDLSDVPSLRLAPGQTLRGGKEAPTIRFRVGQDGVQLSSDNQVSELVLICDVSRRAILNDTSVAHLGRL